MKARIEPAWATRSVRVWLYEEHLDGVRLMGFEDSVPVFAEVAPGAAPEPSLVLPEEALEALVREASAILPPSDATVDALRDTREVRDRLLSLVERTATA